jgi:hypothetical protein
MTYRAYIALSKAGHYTVTIKCPGANGRQQTTHSKGLFSTLERARQHAAEWIAQQEVTA